MFRNVYYDKYNSVIHLWETVDNERKYKKIKFVPYVYVENGDINAQIKSIFGAGVQKKEFNSFRDYTEYCDKTLLDKSIYENNVKPELQFLADYYHHIEDDDMLAVPLRLNIFDIEVQAEKIDMNKVLQIRVNGKKEFCTYEQYQSEFINEKNIEYFNEKYKTWELFDELAFMIRGGFPGPEEAEWPIVLITCYDSFLNRTYSFGLKEYTGKNLKEDWFEYKQCKNEEHLIKEFCLFVKKTQPDIFTGWNVNGFDFPYIFNRVKNIFLEKSEMYTDDKDKKNILDAGDNLLKMFSPIQRINMWKKEINTKTITMIDLAGTSIIDYRDLYKKFSQTLLGVNHESYRLDFIAKYEVEKGKDEYLEEYGSILDFYNKNFNGYLDYNVTDVKRVKQIQEKRKFIEIVQLLSLVSKCPMKHYEAITNVIEGAFLTYYKRNNLAAEHFYGGIKESFEAAYVKAPQIGLHGYGVDIDITSSYPHGIMTLNMGNETYKGKIIKLLNDDSMLIATEELIIKYTSEKEYPEFIFEDFAKKQWYVLENPTGKTSISLTEFNKELQDRKIAIAPNGAMFYTDIRSCLAEIQKYLFGKRKVFKEKMKEWGIKADDLRTAGKLDESEKAHLEYERFKALQIVVKLLINSMYGAISIPVSRQYNLSTAEAICAVGRLAIKNGMLFVNMILNKPEISSELMSVLSEMKSLKKV